MANEVGSFDLLRSYHGEDIEIQLPGDFTIHDIEYLSIWCIRYRENFGHVIIPKNLQVPPALGQTKLTVITLLVHTHIVYRGCFEFVVKLGVGFQN